MDIRGFIVTLVSCKTLHTHGESQNCQRICGVGKDL